MALDTANTPALNTEQVQRILVQSLEAASLLLASRPRIFDPANQIRIPKMGAPIDPDWYWENELIADVTRLFEEVTSCPRT